MGTDNTNAHKNVCLSIIISTQVPNKNQWFPELKKI